MKETENKTEKMEPVTNRGERGWCVVASGLCTDKTRIVIKSGYATKAEADEAAFHEAASQPAGMGTRAAREPKRCKVVKTRLVDGGLLEPLETLVEDASWQDASEAVEQNSDARIVYPSWTFGKKAVAIAASVVLVAAVGIGVAVAAGQPAPVQADAPAASSKAPSPSPEQKAEKSAVMLTVKAEGAEAGATKAKVVAVGESGEIVVAETEVEANKASKIGTLPKGDYELHVTAAPVCGDGSSYKLPEKPVKFSVDGEGGNVKLEVELEKIAADKMTKEQLEASAAALEEAGNSAAAQDVKAKSESAVSQPGSDSEIKRDPTPTPAPDNGNGSGGSGGNSGSGSGDNGGSSSGNGGGQTPPPAAHEHSWTPVTAQQWVPNEVWVEDSAAWDEPVFSTQERAICAGCGADITSDPGSHYTRTGCVNGSSASNWRYETIQIQTGTIHHEATGHYEDKGHNETVVTGYTCSCGATK